MHPSVRAGVRRLQPTDAAVTWGLFHSSEPSGSKDSS